MITLATDEPGSKRRLLTVLFLLLLIGEVVLFAVFFNSTFKHREEEHQIYGLLSYFPDVARYLVFALAGLCVLFMPKFSSYWHFVQRSIDTRPAGLYAVLHFASFALLFLVTSLLTAPQFILTGSVLPHAAGQLLYSLLYALSAVFVITGALVCAPANKLIAFFRQHKLSVISIVLASAGFKLLRPVFFYIENLLHEQLFAFTVAISGWILRTVGYLTIVNVQDTIFGTPSFIVEVAPSCLGYQGAILVVLLLSGYMYVTQGLLRFPQALLLIPLAVLAIWLLNAVRVAVLVAIGTSWSAEVAVHGFHSAAGWINFLLVSLGTILVMQHVRWFSPQIGRSRLSLELDRDNVLLLPQLVLIAASLVTILFTGVFDWLYPLRVVLVGLVLFHYRKQLSLSTLQLDPVSISIGAMVFVAWLMLVSPAPEVANEFSTALFSAPVGVSLVWIVLRCVGAVVIVPLAEELAFRGFLLSFVERQCGFRLGPNASFAVALLISSLAFGAMHGAWIAGVVAGAAFGLAKFRRGRLMDAVIAHSTANLLLGGYVLAFKQWSYW